MKKIYYLFLLLFLSAAVQVSTAQTSFTDDFSGELDEAIWISQEGYTFSIVDEVLNIDISKKDQSENARIEFGDNPIDISANPVLNFKIKADRAFLLQLHFFSGVREDREIYIPKSEVLVPVCVDLFDVDSKFDLKEIDYINFYANVNSVSFGGLVEIDDFVFGDGAVLHANIGGIESPVLYSGEKSQKLMFKDLTNAESVTVSGVDDYLENVQVSPILESTFSDYVYMTFDVKEGEEGNGQMEVTAVGAGDYGDNTISIDYQVVNNMPPTIDQPENQELETGMASMVELTGLSDGDNNLDQKLSLTATSSDQAVLPDDNIKIVYKNGSPYASLYLTAATAGTTDIMVTADDGQDAGNETSVSFTAEAWDNLNIPPTIAPVSDQVPYFDGNESTIMLTGISDGNSNTQALSFTLTSSDQAIVEDGSMSVTDYDPGSGNAILHYTPVGEGTATITVLVADDAAGSDNGVKEDSIKFLTKPVTLYPRGIDWELAKQIDRWSGDSGIELTEDTFDGSDVLKVTCVDKWIWGALNFSFRDTSINLTEHPFVSLEVYSVDVPTLHWLWFYDDYELTHSDAHRNDFPNVTSAAGKAVWAEANQWTTITFDFSGENEMSRNVGDAAEPINAKRIVRILYNYHDQESSWPRPPEYTGTFYIRNFRVGDKAVVPDPNTTVDPVADQVFYSDPGSQAITVTGLTDGRGGIPDISIESLNSGFVSAAVSDISSEGTAEITYEPASGEGEAEVVLTVSADNAVTVKDTFMIKTITKNPESSSGITIDMTEKHQVMRGIGTYMNEYFDLYTQEMGATAMRVGIISNRIEPTNDNSDPYILNRGALNYGAFNWEAMRKMKEMGVETFILTAWSAPGWMKDNYDESWFRGNVVPWEEAQNRTSPFYYDEWAEFFVAAYRMFEEEAGIQLAGIGIQNEPAFYEPYPSAILSPEEFAKIVAVVGKRFEEEGIDCKLYMPEQVFSQNNYSIAQYIDAVHANPDADMYTDVIGVHGYASDGIGSGTPNFSDWTTMYNQAQEGSMPKEMWMTETHRGYSDYDDAMWIALAIYGGLEYGNMGLWTQWGIVGQHIVNGKPTQMLYALANYSRFIKPGAVRVTSTPSHEDLFSTAWVDEARGRFVTVVINDSETPISTYLTGEDVPDSYDLYLTTRIRGFEYMGQTPDSLFLVPPRSIVTLVSAGNTAPTIDPVEDQMLELNAAQQTIMLSGIDPADEGQSIASITASSSNTDLINNLSVGTLQADGTASLTYQPATGQSGMTTVTLTVTDDGPLFVTNKKTMEFDVMVYDAYNNPPVVERIPDQYLLEDMEGTYSVAVAMNDGDDGTQTLAGDVVNSNQDLITNLSFNATSQSVEFEVAPEMYGEATLKLTVTDDGGNDNNNGNQSAIREFKVMVASVNDAPVITQVEDMTVGMNAPEQTVVLDGIDMGDMFGKDQTISITADADDLSLITPPNVIYNQGSTAELKFTPIRNEIGTVNITVYLIDDGGVMNGGSDMTSMTFSVEIAPLDINQAPSMEEINDLDLYLSEGAETLDITGVDDGDEDKEQTISITASSSDEGIVAAPVVNWVPSLNLGSIKLTPVSVGEATITVTVKDNGGTDFGGIDTQNYTFVATVYETVGIDTDELKGIRIYPNPATDQLFLSMPSEFKNYNLIITDLSGKVMINKEIVDGYEEQQLNISDLDAGMYVIVIETENDNLRSIFIKK